VVAPAAGKSGGSFKGHPANKKRLFIGYMLYIFILAKPVSEKKWNPFKPYVEFTAKTHAIKTKKTNIKKARITGLFFENIIPNFGVYGAIKGSSSSPNHL
jgi:hypothetical protein